MAEERKKKRKLKPGFTLSAPSGLSQRLEEESAASRRSPTAMVNMALQEWLSVESGSRTLPRAEEIYPGQVMGTKIFVRLEDEMRSALKIAAPQLGMSMNEALVGIVHRWLDDETALSSAMVQVDGTCSVDLPPRLFRDIGKLIDGATREETVILCLSEFIYAEEEAAIELSDLLEASYLIAPATGEERELLERCRRKCLAGGIRDVLSRIRLRHALVQILQTLEAPLGSDTGGRSILIAARGVAERGD